jgi:hypothetical protein
LLEYLLDDIALTFPGRYISTGDEEEVDDDDADEEEEEVDEEEEEEAGGDGEKAAEPAEAPVNGELKLLQSPLSLLATVVKWPCKLAPLQLGAMSSWTPLLLFPNQDL